MLIAGTNPRGSVPNPTSLTPASQPSLDCHRQDPTPSTFCSVETSLLFNVTFMMTFH
jgi:hypothetical protein